MFGFPRKHRGTALSSISPLTIVTPPVISGTATTGATLTVSTPAVWSGTPVSRTYQWFQDTSPISGATSTNYVVLAGDSGHSLTVKETAYNGSLSTPSQSNAITSGSLTAPTLTRTSADGTNRMSWSGLYPSAIEWDGVDTGDKVDMQFRVNGGSWNADTRQLLDSAALLSGSFSWPVFGGTTFALNDFVEAQERTVRFSGGVVTFTSGWSNIVSDTMATGAGATTTNLHLFGGDVRFSQYNGNVRALDAVTQETV